MRILIALCLLAYSCVASAADIGRNGEPVLYPVDPVSCRVSVPLVTLCQIPPGWVPVRQWWERDCCGRWVLLTTWSPPPTHCYGGGVLVIFIVR